MPDSGRCAIFDLDGTLLDSRLDIAFSVNEMRRELGLPQLSLETVVSYVGDGLKVLAERALRDEDADIEKALDIMKRHYRRNLTVRSRLYPGVPEGLSSLKRAGWRLAMLSNKPIDMCREILDHFNLLDLMDSTAGGGSGFPLKPDPAAILHILEETGSVAASSWMIGDNHTDLEAGTAAKVNTCYTAYGFGDPMDSSCSMRVETFPELIAKLGA